LNRHPGEDQFVYGGLNDPHLRHAAQERGGPLPSIDVADALLDERHSTRA
jgi:hypothetical protein